jgi:hypothetical protein
MPAPAAIFLAPAAGGVAVISKRKQARRAQAASNKWSTQFPLVDDYASQQAMINQAQLQLKTLQAQGGKSKQVRAEIAQLSKWIGVMKSQLKDLKTGMDMASTNLQKAPSPQMIAQAPLPVVQVGTVTDNAPTGVSLSDVAQNVANGDNLAAPTKKPINWLLIGGIAVAAILIFRTIKK